MKVCDPPVWASFFDQQFPPQKNTGELDIISVNCTKRVGVFCHILRKNQPKTPQGMSFVPCLSKESSARTSFADAVSTQGATEKKHREVNMAGINKKPCFFLKGKFREIFTGKYKGEVLKNSTLARPWPRLLWSQLIFIANFGRANCPPQKTWIFVQPFDDDDFLWDFFGLMYIKPLVFYTEKVESKKNPWSVFVRNSFWIRPNFQVRWRCTQQTMT